MEGREGQEGNERTGTGKGEEDAWVGAMESYREMRTGHEGRQGTDDRQGLGRPTGALGELPGHGPGGPEGERERTRETQTATRTGQGLGRMTGRGSRDGSWGDETGRVGMRD